MIVSVGVMVYNEELMLQKFIDSLLNQKPKHIEIREVFFILSGSNKLTKKTVLNYKKINYFKFIFQKERKGKYSAINIFLKKAKSDVLVLSSSDIILDKKCIDALCSPLKNKSVGIVASRPISINKEDSLIHKIEKFQWLIHHQISLKTPKFGELIAFRRIFDKLPPTAVDEEEIAYLEKSKGYAFFYEPKAVVYNQGPDTLYGFLVQRRRIYCGHLILKSKRKYDVSTLSNFKIFLASLSLLSLKNMDVFIFGCFFELLARILGYYDFILGKTHYIWKK